MRVLLTRAAEDAARTGATLRAAGHDIVLSPVIEIVASEATWPAGVIDAVLATSSHAFARPDFGPQPEARRLMSLVLVGHRTVERARERGFAGATIVAANAAALSLAFGTMTHAPRRLVYLAGRDRKPEIEVALATAGQAVEVIEAYRAQGIDSLPKDAETALVARALDAVLHYSRRSATLFAGLASRRGLDIAHLRHLCLSADVAAPLHERGLPGIEIAGAPNEAALLGLLDQDA